MTEPTQKTQLTRQQLLARIAWHLQTFNYDAEMDGMTKRNWLNFQMYGITGYYNLSNEQIQDEWNVIYEELKDEIGENVRLIKWDAIEHDFQSWAEESKLSDYQLCEKASAMLTELLELLGVLQEKDLWEPPSFDVRWSKLEDRFQEGLTQKAYDVYQEQEEKESEEINPRTE